ncbi:MAG: hypothetical protein K2Q11_11925 [Burkholderiaceae bacterium]|nr:hypothetical protein [Burkholderiaceae bacterium]
MINTFCIAHKNIQIPIFDGLNIIWLGGGGLSENSAKNIYISDVSDHLCSWHNFLGGSSGSFAIAEIFDKSNNWDSSDKISVIQYRKFISPVKLGKPSLVYPGMQVIDRLSASSLNLEEMQNSSAGNFLLSQPVNIGGIFSNYSSCHFPSDLLRYMAIAIDVGVLSNQSAVEFISFPILIPGGVEFGVYPISVFLEIINKLRLVCDEFLKFHRPVSINENQRRALAFCNERLGSYLLFKHIHHFYDGVLPGNIFGYMHTISENDYS